MHNIVIGGQPDFLSSIVETWGKHGREINTGDAELVLRQTPAVRHRAPSIGSGEHFYEVNLALWSNRQPWRGILGVVHNLQDVDAKVRAVVCKGSPGYEMVMPTSTVASSNTASTHADVDQDPYGTITTWATPTVQTTDFYLEVGFTNSDPLQTAVEDSQIILVYLKQQGTQGTSLTRALIEVKDGSDVVASKTLRMRLADEDTVIVSLIVDPDDFADPTMNGMSVRVTSDAPGPGGGFVNWDIACIVWQKFEVQEAEGNFGLVADTGWVAVESAENDLFHMNADAQVSSILPYLDANGEVAQTQANVLRVFFTWYDGSVFDGTNFDFKDRIFEDSDGTLTEWRPEIGVVAEGPAWGHRGLAFGQKSGFNDRSTILYSKGGNRWVIRKTTARTLDNVSITNVESVEFVQNIYSMVRRLGLGGPLMVALRPDSPEVSAACSLYAALTAFTPASTARGKPPDQDEMVDLMSVTMNFEEMV